MKIVVRAKPRSKLERVEKIGELEFVVRVKAPPINGRANEAIHRAIAKHFGVSRFTVCLVSGACSRKKVFEIRV